MAMRAEHVDASAEISKPEEQPALTLEGVATELGDISGEIQHFSALGALGVKINSQASEAPLSKIRHNVEPAELERIEKKAQRLAFLLQQIREQGDFPAPEPEEPQPLAAVS